MLPRHAMSTADDKYNFTFYHVDFGLPQIFCPRIAHNNLLLFLLFSDVSVCPFSLGANWVDQALNFLKS